MVMALLRVLEDREYWPESGTLVVRDTDLPGPVPAGINELLVEYATDAQPGGSVARAGIGWVDASASDQYQSVRLESHDAEPDRDPDDWADIVETPFLTNGTVGLTMVTGAPIDDPFGLAGPRL